MDIQTLDVIETGGTIDMEGLDSRKPAEGTRKLLTALESFTPSLELHRPFAKPLDSSNIGPEQWQDILNCVNTLCNRKKELLSKTEGNKNLAAAGIIIAHGTDTLQESSLIMALESSRIRPPFPIVFTCAYAPQTEAGSDALRNLVLAGVIAQSYLLANGERHVVPPGVYVFVGSEIHLASRIKKVTTRPMNNRSYVESIPAPVGQITVSHKADFWSLDVSNEVRLRLHQELLHRPDKDLPPSPSIPLKKFGYVEHLWFKHDSPPHLLEETLTRCHHIGVDENVRSALVLQGDFSRKQETEIQQIVSTLVRFRQGLLQIPAFTGSPKVVQKIWETSKRRDLIFLIPKSLTHSKARTKLSWLLQFDPSLRQLALGLKRDLSGECFEIPVLPDWIAGESYGPNNSADRTSAKRVVIAHPGISPSVYKEASRALLESKTKKRELNIVGFGDGNLPLGTITMAGTLSRYLKNSYGLDLLISELAPFYEIEIELSATLRYDERFRDAVLDRYIIANKKEMARHILLWAKRTVEASDERWTRKVAESLPLALSDTLGISIQRIRLTLERNNSLAQAFLGMLSKERGQTSYINQVTTLLAHQGIDVTSLAFNISGSPEQVGALAARSIEEWLQHIDRRSLSLLARLLSDVFSRRIMKDALVNANDVLATFVRCVDAGVHVNIWTNADMAATDTRKYELGNFLLVAGVDSEEAAGWVSGPLRLRE